MRLGRRALLVAGAGAFTTGCGLAKVHPDVAELEALPGARLAYPGSTTLAYGGTEGDRKMGTNPAAAGGDYAVDAAASEVLGFYSQKLPALGWTPTSPDPMSQWSHTRTWSRPEAFFSVGIYDAAAKRIRRGQYPAAGHLKTIYAVQLMGRSS